MASNTGKNPDGSPLPEKDREELLDELSSVQDMLSDGNNKRAPDEEPPVLEPESPGGAHGSDTEEQMPLLQPDSSDSEVDPANERLRRALSDRPNPFLSDAARKTDPQSRATTLSDGEQRGAAPELSASPKATTDASTNTSGLSERDMRALVDETLAAWLPKIERELRDKLMERLRSEKG